MKNQQETKISFYLTPFQEFLKSQVTASILLLLCTIIAIVWASTPLLSSSYQSFVNLKIGFRFGDFKFEQSLQFWVNDVLLTIFFFYVGLEIKRSFIVGELQNRKRAIFVLWSAFGGMLIPSVIFGLINYNTSTQHGWAIPMATDTAFVIGILTHFKDKLPKGIFPFIASLAIIDDIGAIIIIAIFYTSDINTTLFFISILCVAFLMLANYSGIRNIYIYFTLGFFVWIFMETSGIQGAISGIVVALMIPSSPGLNAKGYVDEINLKLDYFQKRKEKNALLLEDNKQHAILEDIQIITLTKMTLLQHWETKLKYPNSLFILPLFALVNAGVPVNYVLLDDVFSERLSLGILLALFLGKPLGVILLGYISIKLKLALAPVGAKYKHIIGVSFLTGIGFTISIFITSLSFTDNYQIVLAKTAIFVGSILSALVGYIYLYKLSKSE